MTATVTPIRSASQYLSEMDNDQLTCRGQRHQFPVLRPGRKIPRGVTARITDGVTEYEWTCPVCGTVRTQVPGEQYRYSHGKRWMRIPRETGLTAATMRDEAFRRALEDSGVFEAS